MRKRHSRNVLEWGIASGQYFNEWDEARHVVRPFDIPDHWMKFRAMDWGSAAPYACLWFAVDFDGNLYCYRELYGWGGKPNVGTKETARQVAEHICELEKKAEGVSYGVLDYACWAQMGVTGPTIAEEINITLLAHGLNAFGKCSKGRAEGGNALKQRLWGNDMPDGSHKPAIYFFSNCIHTIRTLPILSHDEHKPETYNTKGEDHCFPAGTLITTKHGDVPIENVNVGDYVLTRRGYKKVVKAGLTRKKAHIVSLEFISGDHLRGTPNHPVFEIRNREYKRLDSFKAGDLAIHKQLGVVEVVDVVDHGEYEDVYNLTVDEVPEYFADGFLVHNCADAAVYACLSRPWTPSEPEEKKRLDAWRMREEIAPSAWAM